MWRVYTYYLDKSDGFRVEYLSQNFEFCMFYIVIKYPSYFNKSIT